MSDLTNPTNRGGSSNPWKWMTIGLAGLMAVVLIGGIVRASFERGDETAALTEDEAAVAEETNTAAATPAAPKPAPVRVAASQPAPPPAAPVPAHPSQADMAACNDYAASTRTQTNDVVKNGVVGGALGAAVGAATGAIADGGKGAGRGAGIGAIVGATGGTLYGLNKRNQDDARAETAYRQCMAQRGF